MVYFIVTLVPKCFLLNNKLLSRRRVLAGSSAYRGYKNRRDAATFRSIHKKCYRIYSGQKRFPIEEETEQGVELVG